MPPTESSLGSAAQAASDGFHSLHQEEVKPWLANDIQKHQNCSIDKLLGVFLVRCGSKQMPTATPPQQSVASASAFLTLPSTPSPTSTEKATVTPTILETVCPAPAPASTTTSPISTEEVLLHKCIEAVRPICDSLPMRELLKTYCETPGPESERYAPFARAFNHALVELQQVIIPELRPAVGNTILFHVNDPKTTRKPDINLVSMESVKRVHPEDVGAQNDDFSRKLCLESPPESFQWPEVLSTFEFKRGNTKVLPEPPLQYLDPLPPPVLPFNLSGTTDRLSLTDGTSGFAPTTTSVSEDLSSTSNTSDSTSQLGAATSRRSARKTASRSDVEVPAPAAAWDELRAAAQSRQKHISDKTSEAITQCGLYATEMLCSSTGKQHAICVLIVDAVAWVWWFDRQGAIQLEGIDFVKDLPRFLVLLLSFQRFSVDNWGYNSKLDPVNLPFHDATTDHSTPFRTTNGIEITLVPEEVYAKRRGLTGRCTRVTGAKSASFCANTKQGLADTSLVTKAYWPNEKRLSEQEIVWRGCEIPGAAKHLPRIYGSYDGYRTREIREQLGIADEVKQPPRVFRVLVLERLYPITDLQGQRFIEAWLQCSHWHYMLWQGGVEHRDLSPSNLMIRPSEEVVGVLNDWDLSFIAEGSQDVGEHAATIPFLAGDLVCKEYWEGKVQVLYRHDLESFVWILLWAFLCYHDGKETIPTKLREWQTADLGCKGKRLDFLTTLHALDATPGWTTEWPILANFVAWLIEQNYGALRPKLECSNRDVRAKFVGLLKEASEIDGLDYLHALVT